MGNAQLTEEQYKFIDQRALWSARNRIQAREYLPVKALNDIGVQVYSYDEYTDMGDAQLTWTFRQSDDMVNITRSNQNIPLLSKSWRINERDLASSRRYGTPLDTANAESAAYRVAELENEFIVQGFSADGTNYDIDGLYQGAGNDYSTTKDFGTAGNAIDAVQGAIDLIEADGIRARRYNLVCARTQYGELRSSITGSGAGVSEFEFVKDLIGGEIYKDHDLTAGTAMLLPAREEIRPYVELVVAKDFTTVTEPIKLKDGGGLWGMCYEALVPVIRDSNAICKLSAI
jgi:uncharacterized linocin/CFP29 family protein